MQVIDESGRAIKQPTTANRALKLKIDTGGQAVPNTAGRYIVAIKNTNAFYNVYGAITARTTTDSDGNILVEYFDAGGSKAEPKNAGLPPFQETEYDLAVYDLTLANGTNLSDVGSSICSPLSFNVKASNGVGNNLCKFNITDETYTVDPKDKNFDPTQYLRPGDTINASIDACPSDKTQTICNTLHGLIGDPFSLDANVFQVFIKDGSGKIISGGGSAELGSVNSMRKGGELGQFDGGNYLIDVKLPVNAVNPNYNQNVVIECAQTFTIDAGGGNLGCSTDNDCVNNPNGPYCMPDTNGSLSCQTSNNGLATNPCVDNGNNSFACQTAIGAISTDAGGFAKGLLQLFFALAGLILLFVLIGNGYKFMTSQGDEEKVKEAREAIMAAVAGLVLVAFSIVILQFITVDVLHLPGFGG